MTRAAVAVGADGLSVVVPSYRRKRSEEDDVNVASRLLAIIVGLSVSATAAAEASAIEIDAAVARMSSAAYNVELFAACGYPRDMAEKKAAMDVAVIMALQKDGLSQRLTNDEFVDAVLRVKAPDLEASMSQRAKNEATPEECAKQANRDTWDALLRMSQLLKKQPGLERLPASPGSGS